MEELADIKRRLATAESMLVRPEAAQSLHDALPKGILARQSLTVNSPAFGSSANTDFVLSGVEARADRTYSVWLKAIFVPSSLSNWHIFVTANNGTSTFNVDRLWREPEVGNNARTVSSGVLWEPAADGTYTLRVRQILASGSGTITYFADSATSDLLVNRRTFWVRDEGPRLP